MRHRACWKGFVVVLAVCAVASSAAAEVRTWTDSTGKHTIQAELVALDDDVVKLLQDSGKEIEVPLARLSKADQDFVADHLARSGQPKDEPKPKPPTRSKASSERDEESAAVMAIAKEFFTDLRTDERNAARALLTDKAQEINKAAGSYLSKLPKPDPGSRSIRVAKPRIDGDNADAPVKVRAGGTLIETALHLSLDGDQWRIVGISAETPRGQQTIEFEQPAPDPKKSGNDLEALVGRTFELQGLTLDGTPVDISQFAGKVVLVDFWATWCGPCRAEIPNMLATYQQHHEDGFEVIAVSIDKEIPKLLTFVAEEAPPWVVLADRHPRNRVSMSNKYGIHSIPAFILVGRDGKVAEVNCRGKRLEPAVKRLLAESAPSLAGD